MVNSVCLRYSFIFYNNLWGIYSKNALALLFSYCTKFEIMCHFGTLVKISICHLRLLCAMPRDLAQKKRSCPLPPEGFGKP